MAASPELDDPAAPRAVKRAKVAAEEEETSPSPAPAAKKEAARLTVWCKSLVFHGEGYAVFDDADGRMVFRVDNYGGRRSRSTAMALMDHAGRVLLTVRRRQRRHCKALLILGLVETWEVYKGDVEDEDDTRNSCSSSIDRQLVMRATKDLGNSSCTVSMVGCGGDGEPAVYRMCWSRREEWSRVHCSGSGNSLVAEVRRKRGGPRKTTLLGKDVLSLTIQPGMDQAIAMAMLIISNSYR
uniref:Tubby C-terminal domain-containing protein n=1 Tax=Leersia perrieri TaxID=77586 RepID=A0A0D9WCZ1_9ORYZ